MCNAGSIAVVVIVLFVAVPAIAKVRTHDAKSANSIMQSSPMLAVSAHHALVATLALPPEEKPKAHWPWWLRILAVIGVLVFIRVVAGSMRNRSGTPGPN